MTGRPSSYSQEQADELCDWLRNGGSLRAWCAQEGKPTFSTVYRWLEYEEGFSDAYARAREVQAHNDGDRMNEIIAQVAAGTLGQAEGRVMMDGLKWTAGKRMPAVYGDKLAVTSDDKRPIVLTWANGEKA